MDRRIMETIGNGWTQFLGLLRTFQITDLMDILMVSYLIYKGIQLLKETKASQLIKGLVVLALVVGFVKLCHLKMMDYLLSNILQIGLFALVVVFQPELRKMLEQLGRTKWSNWKFLNLGKKAPEMEQVQQEKCIHAVVEACMILRNMKMGALIVFERSTKLGEIIQSGTLVNATASTELIWNIFFNKAPLHDGAMILRDGMVHAAGCILPLTQDTGVSSELGTRHRAALGMSENSDAVVVVVSEETGNMSLAINGHLTRNYTKDTLTAALKKELIVAEQESDKKLGISSLKIPHITIKKKEK